MTTSLTLTQRHVLRIVLAVSVGLAGAWSGMAIWGASDVEMGPFLVRVDTRFGTGTTEIVLPPFGHLTANTHTAPLNLQATLLDVRIPELSRSLREGTLQTLVEAVRQDAVDALRLHLLKVLLVTLATAVVMAVVAFRRDLRSVLIAALASIVAVGGVQILSAATFRSEAFGSPTYSGSLALAARLIPPGRAAEQIDAFQDQLTRVVDGAIEAYTSIQTNPVGGAGEIRILHISDVHLAPFGFEFARQVARGFDVDLVIDTGDTTSWGTEPETLVTPEIREFDRPYLWVRGNHDSRGLQADLARLDTVEVLDGNGVLLHGLRIYGLGSPIPPAITRELPDEVFEERVRAEGERVVADLEALPPVDIVAVHDDRMAEAAAGLVPLVLSGHFHEEQARVIDGTLFLRVGTTGGSAFATFETDEGIPLSAEVLYFEPGSPPRLIAYDVIEQSPKTGTLTVERHVIEDEFGELIPSPQPPPSESPSATETPSEFATVSP